jgi:hypothetical protein
MSTTTSVLVLPQERCAGMSVIVAFTVYAATGLSN